jgi:hypothetical protein
MKKVLFLFPLSLLTICWSVNGNQDPKPLLILDKNPSSWIMKCTTRLPSGIAFVNEPATYEVEIENKTNNIHDADLCIQTTTEDGKRSTRNLKVTIPGRKKISQKITLPTKEPCFQLWRLSLNFSGRKVAETAGSLAVVLKPLTYGKDDPNSYFGLCEVWDNEAAERIGCKNLRWGGDWRFMEPEKGNYSRLPEFARSLVELQKKHGMRVMLTLQPYPPAWAAWKIKGKPNLEMIPAPEYMPNWKNFVKKLMEHSKGKLAGLDIQNEPNLAYWFGLGLSFNEAVDIYAKLVELARQGAKEADPEGNFCGLGVGGDYDMDYKYTRGVLDKGAQLDVFTGHPYAPSRFFGPGKFPRMPDDWLEDACRNGVKLMVQHKRPPRMWVGELGYALDPAVPELSKYSLDFAAAITQALITCHSVPGVEKHFHFLQRPYLEGGYNYGLFRGTSSSDMYPLPAASAYASCAYFLHHANVVQKINLGSARAWLFNRPEENLSVVPLWTNQGTLRLIGTVPAPAGIYNSFGKQVAQGPRLDLMFGSLPYYIVVPLAQGSELVRQIQNATLKSQNPVLIKNCYQSTIRRVTLCLFNTLNNTVTAVIKVNDRRIKQQLPPGETVITLALNKPTTKIMIEAEGSSQICNLPQDLIPIFLNHSKTPIIINERKDVLPPDPTIPWKSPEDLTISASFAWNPEFLFFCARVRDKNHVAPQSGLYDFFNSDSIQMAIDPDNNSGDDYGSDDREIGFVLGKEGAKAYLTYPQPFLPLDCKIKITREENLTLYEAAVTWKSLNIVPPKEGRIMAINFVVNQNDGQGRIYWMGLTPGIAEGKFPKAFRKFIFVNR